MEVAGAGDEMVVGQAGSLHEGVDHRRSNKAKAMADHVFADGF